MGLWGVETMKNLRVVVEPHAADSLKQIVREGLGAYNLAKTGYEEYYPVSIFLRDANDEVLGGVLGEIWAQWLFVSHLWLAAPLRRHGYGRKLLLVAESYAMEKGCHSAYLTTSSFQARPFYEKLGYEVFAELDDFPPGHQHYFLKKRLAVGSKAQDQRRQIQRKTGQR
jgi:GNAT superfamily N-acetyltransferase